MNREILGDMGVPIANGQIDKLIDATWDTGFVLVDDNKIVGAIGALPSGHLTTGNLILQQIFWYVEPIYRRHSVKLLNALEEQAKAMGAQAVLMSMMIHEKTEHMERFYQMHGYKKFEIQYKKEVSE
jgi:GNAT superfamily N-acetyltransferase